VIPLTEGSMRGREIWSGEGCPEKAPAVDPWQPDVRLSLIVPWAYQVAFFVLCRIPCAGASSAGLADGLGRHCNGLMHAAVRLGLMAYWPFQHWCGENIGPTITLSGLFFLHACRAPSVAPRLFLAAGVLFHPEQLSSAGSHSDSQNSQSYAVGKTCGWLRCAGRRRWSRNLLLAWREVASNQRLSFSSLYTTVKSGSLDSM